MKKSVKVADCKKQVHIINDLNSVKLLAPTRDVKFIVDFLIESGGFAFNSDREFWFGKFEEINNHLQSLPEGQAGEIIDLSTLFLEEDECKF